jgi:hypothetical protein
MTFKRKESTQFVEWSQQAILRRISELESSIAAIARSSGYPDYEASGAIVRNPRDVEFMLIQTQILEVLERIQSQLSLLTDVDLKAGEKL